LSDFIGHLLLLGLRNVAKMGEQGNASIILVGKHTLKRPFRRRILGWVLTLRRAVEKWVLGRKENKCDSEACPMAGHSINTVFYRINLGCDAV
jgi:hypothetical protein